MTTFCNQGAKRYIPGLSDGNVITLKGNFAVIGGTDKTIQDELIALLKAVDQKLSAADGHRLALRALFLRRGDAQLGSDPLDHEAE